MSASCHLILNPHVFARCTLSCTIAAPHTAFVFLKTVCQTLGTFIHALPCTTRTNMHKFTLPFTATGLRDSLVCDMHSSADLVTWMQVSRTNPVTAPRSKSHLRSSSSSRTAAAAAADCRHLHTAPAFKLPMPNPPNWPPSPHIPAAHSSSVPLGHGVPHAAFATSQPSEELGPQRTLDEHGHSPEACQYSQMLVREKQLACTCTCQRGKLNQVCMGGMARHIIGVGNQIKYWPMYPMW